jgi:deaminated glutathione amidase
MTTGNDTSVNLATAERLVRHAAAAGARLVLLPEKWNFIDQEDLQVAAAEPIDGPSMGAAVRWARELEIAIVAGSISEALPGESRAYNTCVVIQPDGTSAAHYRKLHLFDVEVGGRVYRESDGAIPGDEVVVTDVLGRRLGLSVCYDLRFPELFRALSTAGAEIITVPAAFTAVTGEAHWEVLLRARAIENQAFVIAAGQVGTHATGATSHGHSMIVDPWGIVLAQAQAGEQIVVADLDFAELARIRTSLPALRHRRVDLFGATTFTPTLPRRPDV